MGAVLSYQSARSGWKMIFAGVLPGVVVGLLASSVRAAPYRDDRRGFSLELTEGWRLAPRFGETEAMVFERRFSSRRGRRTATLSVRRLPVEVTVARLQAELQRVWGDRVGRAAAIDPAPPGLRHLFGWRYRPQGEARTRSAEAHGFVTDGRRFLVTLESAPRDVARFRIDVGRLLSTFEALAVRTPALRPANDRVLRAGAPKAGAPAPPPRPNASATVIVGRWIRPQGDPIEFFADGRYRLADVSGRYRWRSGQLELTGTDGASRRFTVVRRGDRLEMVSSALPKPLVFERFRPMVALAGLWRADLPKGTLILNLQRNGNFALGSHRGRWSVEGARLVLRKSKTEQLTYNWKLSVGILTLSGGDLDRPLLLSRR